MTTGRARDADDESETPAGSDAAGEVSMCRVTSERWVLVEADNSDGWIASDLTVAPDP